MSSRRKVFFLAAVAVLSFFVSAAETQARLGRPPRHQERPGRGTTFHFKPPAGTTYLETQHITHIKDSGSKGKQTTVSEDKYQITFAASSTGYAMTIRKIDSQVTHEGKPVVNPVAEKVKGMAIVQELDGQGRIQKIEGQEAILEQIKASLPPEKALAIGKLFNEAALTQRAQLAWHSRLSRLVGQSLAKKEILVTREALALPTGHTAGYYLASRFADELPCKAARCVKLQLTFDSSLDSLKRRLGKRSLEVTGTSMDVDLPVMPQAEVSGNGEQVIDPATMLLYSERLSRTVSWPMSSSSDEVLRARFEEDQQTSFEYPAQQEKKP